MHWGGAFEYWLHHVDRVHLLGRREARFKVYYNNCYCWMVKGDRRVTFYIFILKFPSRNIILFKYFRRFGIMKPGGPESLDLPARERRVSVSPGFDLSPAVTQSNYLV